MCYVLFVCVCVCGVCVCCVMCVLYVWYVCFACVVHGVCVVCVLCVCVCIMCVAGRGDSRSFPQHNLLLFTPSLAAFGEDVHMKDCQ